MVLTKKEWLEQNAGIRPARRAEYVQPSRPDAVVLEKKNKALVPLFEFVSWQVSLSLSGCDSKVPSSNLFFAQGRAGEPASAPLPEPSGFYDAFRDEALQEFLHRCRRVFDEDLPTCTDPHFLYAKRLLLDPATCQAVWAHPHEILKFERKFLAELIEWFADGMTPIQLQSKAAETYHIGPVYASELLSKAMFVLAQGSHVDDDEIRKVMLNYTFGEDMKQARMGGDVRAAMSARKALATVHGIAAAPREVHAESSAEDMIHLLLDQTRRLTQEEEDFENQTLPPNQQ